MADQTPATELAQGAEAQRLDTLRIEARKKVEENIRNGTDTVGAELFGIYRQQLTQPQEVPTHDQRTRDEAYLIQGAFAELETVDEPGGPNRVINHLRAASTILNEDYKVEIAADTPDDKKDAAIKQKLRADAVAILDKLAMHQIGDYTSEMAEVDVQRAVFAATVHKQDVSITEATRVALQLQVAREGVHMATVVHYMRTGNEQRIEELAQRRRRQSEHRQRRPETPAPRPERPELTAARAREIKDINPIEEKAGHPDWRAEEVPGEPPAEPEPEDPAIKEEKLKKAHVRIPLFRKEIKDKYGQSGEQAFDLISPTEKEEILIRLVDAEERQSQAKEKLKNLAESPEAVTAEGVYELAVAEASARLEGEIIRAETDALISGKSREISDQNFTSAVTKLGESMTELSGIREAVTGVGGTLRDAVAARVSPIPSLRRSLKIAIESAGLGADASRATLEQGLNVIHQAVVGRLVEDAASARVAIQKIHEGLVAQTAAAQANERDQQLARMVDRRNELHDAYVDTVIAFRKVSAAADTALKHGVVAVGERLAHKAAPEQHRKLEEDLRKRTREIDQAAENDKAARRTPDFEALKRDLDNHVRLITQEEAKPEAEVKFKTEASPKPKTEELPEEDDKETKDNLQQMKKRWRDDKSAGVKDAYHRALDSRYKLLASKVTGGGSDFIKKDYQNSSSLEDKINVLDQMETMFMEPRPSVAERLEVTILSREDIPAPTTTENVPEDEDISTRVVVGEPTNVIEAEAPTPPPISSAQTPVEETPAQEETGERISVSLKEEMGKFVKA
ncbi:MAG: hypothetical protein ACD_52C00294G0004, partial [uncultured bacterium]